MSPRNPESAGAWACRTMGSGVRTDSSGNPSAVSVTTRGQHKHSAQPSAQSLHSPELEPDASSSHASASTPSTSNRPVLESVATISRR